MQTVNKDKMGMSEVLSETTDDSVVSIMQVSQLNEEPFWDERTVSTHWELD